MTTILVMAKTPEPGRTKTRLCPPFTAEQAAALAEAALVDTLAAVGATPARRRVLVLDGRAGPWLPEGMEVWEQADGGLDARIAAALAAVTGPALVVGMDTPQLTPEHLAVSWVGHGAWFGPAADGGFWGLGLREPDPDLVRGVPMSMACTGFQQLARLVDRGISVGRLPMLRDVDTAADADAVAEQCPATRFAALYHELRATHLSGCAPSR